MYFPSFPPIANNRESDLKDSERTPPEVVCIVVSALLFVLLHIVIAELLDPQTKEE